MTTLARWAAVVIVLWAIALSPSVMSAQGDAAVQPGNQTFQYWCAPWHGRGPGNPGTTALAAKYMGALAGVLEDRKDLTPQAVRFAVRRGTSIMPFFRKTEVSDADLDAMTQYLTRRPPARSDGQKP